eukprot:10122507-Prorocentrum_lima.AAC.1
MGFPAGHQRPATIHWLSNRAEPLETSTTEGEGVLLKPREHSFPPALPCFKTPKWAADTYMLRSFRIYSVTKRPRHGFPKAGRPLEARFVRILDLGVSQEESYAFPL